MQECGCKPMRGVNKNGDKLMKNNKTKRDNKTQKWTKSGSGLSQDNLHPFKIALLS